jgi:hypothetical protein
LQLRPVSQQGKPGDQTCRKLRDDFGGCPVRRAHQRTCSFALPYAKMPDVWSSLPQGSSQLMVPTASAALQAHTMLHIAHCKFILQESQHCCQQAVLSGMGCQPKLQWCCLSLCCWFDRAWSTTGTPEQPPSSQWCSKVCHFRAPATSV